MAFIRVIAVLLIGAALVGCVPWPYTGSCDSNGLPYNSNTAYIATNCSEYCSYKIPGLCKNSSSDLLQAVSTKFAEQDKRICGGFGFQLGSDGMANCLMAQSNKRDADDAATLKAQQQAEAAQRQAASESIDSFKKQNQIKPTTTTRCTPRYDGSMTCTTN